MAEKSVLVTRPWYRTGDINEDSTIVFIFRWPEKIICACKEESVPCYDLKESRASRKTLEKFLTSKNPKVVALNGHGGPAHVCGQNGQAIADVDNAHVFSGRIVHALSCNSAQIFGEDCVKKGALAFIGYKDRFKWFFDPNMITRPFEDEMSNRNFEAALTAITAVIRGESVKNAREKSQRGFEGAIKHYLIHYGLESNVIIMSLVHNMQNQVVLGDGTAVL